jgi:uncharacterized membrane protein
MRDKTRVPAIDVMRGLVMILMTLDHSSDAFNRGRLVTDSATMWTPGMPLPTGQFLLRWVTHLCAPTFVLLAGASLALSTETRVRRGDPPAAIDRHIALRGLLLVAFDVVWMSAAFVGPGRVLLQVLYAIGASLMCMVVLRRLSDAALLAVGIGLALLEEPLAALSSMTGIGNTFVVALLVTGGTFARAQLIVGYPLLPWLGILCAGFVLGRKLLRWDGSARDRHAARILAAWGVGLLTVFIAVRGMNSVGNMGLLRDDASFVQWLHVSKYPPSIAFDALELGLAGVLLAAFFTISRRRLRFVAPVAVLGQVALFYYLLHVHVLVLAGQVGGVRGRLGVGATFAGAAGTLALLYPLSVAYRRYKHANPGGWRQYV